MKFSIKDFFSKCGLTCSFLQIWSNLLKKSLKDNFIFCSVYVLEVDLDYTKDLPELHNECPLVPDKIEIKW